MTLRSSRAHDGSRLRASLVAMAVAIATILSLLGGAVRASTVDATLVVAADAGSRLGADRSVASTHVVDGLPGSARLAKTSSPTGDHERLRDRDDDAHPSPTLFAVAAITTRPVELGGEPTLAPLPIESHARRHARLMVFLD